MAIEERLKKLENRMALLVSVTDCEKHPFICTCLDADMDIVQVDQVLALLSKTENSFSTSNEISYSMFEEELKAIVPTKKNDPQFAKTIISALNRENKFILGVKKFNTEGLEI